MLAKKVSHMSLRMTHCFFLLIHLEQLTITNNLVAWLALNVARIGWLAELYYTMANMRQKSSRQGNSPSKAYTASILFIGWVIQTLLHRQGTSP